MSRYDLTDFEWRVIEPLLPNKQRGVPRVSDRRVLNSIFWVLRSGAPCVTCPSATARAPLATTALCDGGRQACGPADGGHHRPARWQHSDDRQHLCSRPPASCDGKKGGRSLSRSVAAGSRPRSMSLSMRKASRSGLARSPSRRMTARSPTRCSTISVVAPTCWRIRSMTLIGFVS